MTYTQQKISDVKKLVESFVSLTDIQKHGLDIELKQIAKAAVSDFQKKMICDAYIMNEEINKA